MTFPFPSHYLPSRTIVLAIVFHCLGHSKNVYDDDDDDGKRFNCILGFRFRFRLWLGCMFATMISGKGKCLWGGKCAGGKCLTFCASFRQRPRSAGTPSCPAHNNYESPTTSLLFPASAILASAHCRAGINHVTTYCACAMTVADSH